MTLSGTLATYGTGVVIRFVRTPTVASISHELLSTFRRAVNAINTCRTAATVFSSIILQRQSIDQPCSRSRFTTHTIEESVLDHDTTTSQEKCRIFLGINSICPRSAYADMEEWHTYGGREQREGPQGSGDYVSISPTPLWYQDCHRAGNAGRLLRSPANLRKARLVSSS